MIDYQWPSPDSDKFPDIKLSNSIFECKRIKNEIETFFQQKVNTRLLLVPSGRSAISILLKFYKLNRSHIIFAPKWSSHCVWDIVTKVANPTITPTQDVNLGIAVHKFGSISTFKNKKTFKVIEDSVDSIISDSNSLFPNNGEFEIISLTKIIGSYSGGLILCKNEKLFSELKESIKDNYDLGSHQSNLKLGYALGNNSNYMKWECNESDNTTLDFKALRNIHDCLINYELNSNIISNRLKSVYIKLGIRNSRGRLPSVISIPINNHESINENILIRNINFTGFFDESDYKPAYLLPLHFQVCDEDFAFYLNILEKNKP